MARTVQAIEDDLLRCHAELMAANALSDEWERLARRRNALMAEMEQAKRPPAAQKRAIGFIYLGGRK